LDELVNFQNILIKIKLLFITHYNLVAYDLVVAIYDYNFNCYYSSSHNHIIKMNNLYYISLQGQLCHKHQKNCNFNCLDNFNWSLFL
jgi:hypothetical protein